MSYAVSDNGNGKRAALTVALAFVEVGGVGRVGDEGGFGTSGGAGGLGAVGVDDGDGAVTACEVVGACVITFEVSCGLGAEAEASLSVGA